MTDTKELIDFDNVLKEIEVDWDISEGNYDILRYYRNEYKNLLAEVERLREEVYDLTRANDTAWALSEVSEEEVKRLREAIVDIADDMVENLPNNLRVYVSKLRKVIE